MKVSCGVNGEPWTDENPLFLCHHCGMPVCLQHGKIIGADDDFAAAEKLDHRPAMHCPTCVRDHPGGKRAYSGSWIDQKIWDEAEKENLKWNAATLAAWVRVWDEAEKENLKRNAAAQAAQAAQAARAARART